MPESKRHNTASPQPITTVLRDSTNDWLTDRHCCLEVSALLLVVVLYSISCSPLSTSYKRSARGLDASRGPVGISSTECAYKSMYNMRVLSAAANC